jgi:biotin synthase-like enzyme
MPSPEERKIAALKSIGDELKRINKTLETFNRNFAGWVRDGEERESIIESFVRLVKEAGVDEEPEPNDELKKEGE